MIYKIIYFPVSNDFKVYSSKNPYFRSYQETAGITILPEDYSSKTEALEVADRYNLLHAQLVAWDDQKLELEKAEQRRTPITLMNI